VQAEGEFEKFGRKLDTICEKLCAISQTYPAVLSCLISLTMEATGSTSVQVYEDIRHDKTCLLCANPSHPSHDNAYMIFQVLFCCVSNKFMPKRKEKRGDSLLYYDFLKEIIQITHGTL
jgi:hypothetical protein